jgi:hypothetical protein
MRTFVFGVALLFTAGIGLAAQPDSKTPDEFDQKQKALRDEIEQLQKRIDALKKQQADLKKKENQAKLEAERRERERQAKEAAEKKAKEEAEKKKHFAKVEIRGKLVKAQAGAWQLSINELTWTLQLDKKELTESAEKLAGQGVVVKGVVVNKKPPYPFGGYGWPMPPNPGWPNPNPGWPNPNPGWPNPNPGWPNPYFQYYESPVTINVESIAAAKD